MEKYPKVVVYAATRNFYKYLPMAISSLLDTNPDALVIVIAEDEYIDSIVHEQVQVINYNDLPQYLDPNGPNYNSYWTYMSLTRLFMSKFITAPRALWLDVDTLVFDDLTDLFNEDMTNKVVGSVMEPRNLNIDGMTRPYINSGVSLFNLDLIRELKIDDDMIKMINSVKCNFPDQDVINHICKFRIKYLHPKYNVSPSTSLKFKPTILHFTCQKIWDNPSVKLWQKYYREKL